MFRPETLLELLRAVGQCEPCELEQFARLAFPNSAAWSRLPKRPRRGSRPGGRARSAAAGVAGRLRSDGWVTRDSEGRISLTDAGRARLSSRTEKHETSGFHAGTSAAPQAPIRAQPTRSASFTSPHTMHHAPLPQWVPHPSGAWVWFDGASFWMPDGAGGYVQVPPAAPGHERGCRG